MPREKKGADLLNINTVVLDKKWERECSNNPQQCCKSTLLPSKLTDFITEWIRALSLMNGHLWCTDTFAADVTGSHAKHICFVGVLQIKVVLLNLAAMLVCFSLDKGDWRSQRAFTFLYTSKPTSFLAWKSAFDDSLGSSQHCASRLRAQATEDDFKNHLEADSKVQDKHLWNHIMC